MTTKQILKFISAKYFFPKFAPGVKNWTHKMRGKDGRGQEISFTKEDDELIILGITKLSAEAMRSSRKK